MNGKNDYTENAIQKSVSSASPMKIWFWLWIGTLTVFAYEIYMISIVRQGSTSSFGWLFFLNILLGLVAFVGMIFTAVVRKSVLYFYILFFIFSLLVFSFGGSIRNKNTYVIPVPTASPDPVITCSWNKINNIQVCADKQMRKSECDDSICCNLYNGSFSAMSKIQCAEFQAKIKTNNPAPQQVQRLEIPTMRPIPTIRRPERTNCSPNGIGGFNCTTY